MSYGHGRNSGIPRLRDYNQAKQWEADTKPIRGKSHKPLGHRRSNRTYQIRMDNDVVVCRLYRTDVIKFYPTGEVHIKTEGWNSQSTVSFIGEVLGLNAGVRDYKTVILLGAGKFVVGYTDADAMRVKRDERGVYQLTSEVKPYIVHSIDRKAMNQVRKVYVDFIQYMQGIVKLRADEHGKMMLTDADFGAFGLLESLYLPHSIKRNAQTIMDLVQHDGLDTNNDYKAVMLLALCSGVTQYFYKSNPISKMVCDLAGMTKAFNEVLIMLHRDTVLRAVELPIGTIKADTYAWAF